VTLFALQFFIDECIKARNTQHIPQMPSRINKNALAASRHAGEIETEMCRNRPSSSF